MSTISAPNPAKRPRPPFHSMLVLVAPRSSSLPPVRQPGGLLGSSPANAGGPREPSAPSLQASWTPSPAEPPPSSCWWQTRLWASRPVGLRTGQAAPSESSKLRLQTSPLARRAPGALAAEPASPRQPSCLSVKPCLPPAPPASIQQQQRRREDHLGIPGGRGKGEQAGPFPPHCSFSAPPQAKESQGRPVMKFPCKAASVLLPSSKPCLGYLAIPGLLSQRGFPLAFKSTGKGPESQDSGHHNEIESLPWSWLPS